MGGNGVGWGELLSGLIGAVIGGGLSILGGWFGGRESAERAAGLAGGVAARIRQAERQEEALLEIIVPVEAARDGLRAAVEDHTKAGIATELATAIVEQWKRWQRFLPPTSIVRDAYDAAQIGALRTEWKQLVLRLAGTSKLPDHPAEVLRQLLAGVEKLEAAMREVLDANAPRTDE